MKTSKLTVLEYKQTIQSCVVAIVLDSLILYSQGKKLTDFTGLFSSCHFEKRMTK